MRAALEEVVRRKKLRKLAQWDLTDLTPERLAELRAPRVWLAGIVLLADTSAWAWSLEAGRPTLRTVFAERLEDGEITTCDAVVAELLFSVRSPEEFAFRRDRLSRLRRCPIREREWRRALDVMEELGRRSSLGHRAVQHQDLLIAAAAEAAGLPVLHYDEDYERIAAVTGQPAEWLAPEGSLR